MTVYEALCGNPYPGRGLLVGMAKSGRQAVCVYFIMGRSLSSRNRVFIRSGGDVLTKARDEGVCVHPELLIYAPVRTMERCVIVGNGDQTDTVRETLIAGGGFEKALESRTFEPDAPNFTPRITGVLYHAEKRCEVGILSCPSGDGATCERRIYREELVSGCGSLIHTYWQGDPTQPFRGAPKRIGGIADIDTLTNSLWDALNFDNRVSLYVRYIDVETGAVDDRLINRY